MAEAIVTGGAIRVGKAISLALAAAGYDIILVFNHSFEQANKTASEIKSLGRNCYLHRDNLGEKSNIDSLFAEISHKYDDIRMLINNASIFEKHSFLETSEEIFDRHINVNFKAPFFLTQNFARYVQKKDYIKNAHVINMLDKEISENRIGHFIYHISKKSLYEFSRMAAKDLAPKIRINSISLGKVLPSKTGNDANLKLSEYPKIAEVTNAILKLDNSNVTGENIIIESDPNLI